MSEKTTSYEQMMFADYPDIIGISDLQKMLGIGRKAALELAKHPQIRGVIDTLQKIRSTPDPKANSSVYGKGYQDISALKKLADSLGIAIVLYHTRP